MLFDSLRSGPRFHTLLQVGRDARTARNEAAIGGTVPAAPSICSVTSVDGLGRLASRLAHAHAPYCAALVLLQTANSHAGLMVEIMKFEKNES